MANTIDIGSYIRGICYTKAEIDTALGQKAAIDHTHDNVYTKTAVDSKIEAVNAAIISHEKRKIRLFIMISFGDANLLIFC